MLKKRLNVPVGGYVIGPFTLAGLMMGANEIAMATLESPDVVQATVNFAERVVIAYARALEEAGADTIAILDPTCVILSPESYRTFCAPAVENVIRHLAVPAILHICGNTEHLLGPMCETGAQGLSLDSMVNFPGIAPQIPGDVVLIGNINPTSTMLFGSRQDVRQQTAALLEAMEPYPNFIMSTGCDLPFNTPLENIIEMVQTTKAFRPGK
jgi:uroporphyrinogen decarboxylase